MIVLLYTVQMWESLVEKPAFASDRDTCFRWFAKVKVTSIHVAVHCSCTLCNVHNDVHVHM